MSEVTYEIIDELGVISENRSGWTLELNLISWNGNEPKYDIRNWSPDHSRLGKGITLTADDIMSLKELLANIDIEE